MSQTLEAAQKYARDGWHVIPVRKNSKVAAVRWDKYRHQPPTPAELQQWFGRDEHNIAVLTGRCSSLYVVDIDNGVLVDDWLSRHPTGMVARTPKGGAHLYYELKNGAAVGNTARKLHKDVDTRGDGGYVLVPPSTVGGIGYQWQQFKAAAPLPDDLLQAVSRPADPEISPPPNDDTRLVASVLGKGFTPHRHNDEMYALAGFFHRNGLNSGALFGLLRYMDEHDATPLGKTERVATIRSALRADKNQREEPEEPFKVLNVDEMIDTYENQDTRWLIDEWVAENAIIAMVADPGSYKTWLSLEAAIVVALGDKGTSFMSKSSNRKKSQPVLVVQQEDSLGRMMERVKTILECKSLPVSEEVTEDGEVPLKYPMGLPLYFHPLANLRFDNAAAMQGMEQVIRERQVKLVVLDPLYWLDPTDENFFAGTAGGGIAALKRMRNDYGVSFLIVHHTRKSGGSGRKKVYGSQLLNAAFEGVILIEKSEDGNTLNVTKEGKTYPDTLKGTIQPVISTGHTKQYDMVFTAESGDWEVELSIHVPAVAEFLEKGAAQWWTRAEISRMTGVGESSLDAPLNDLYHIGKMDRRKKDRGKGDEYKWRNDGNS